ncbi:hypothetical protein PF011_g8188 [Phytophthora fragariae]|nr:hypothetical protein PF011_g8188 [Phytophthora fragariae]
MAFQKAEHNSLMDALRVITPFAVVPNRHQLATTLLDMCYDDLRSKLMLSAKGKRVTLTTDGYPTPTGRLSSTTCCSLRHPPCPDQLDFVTIAAVVTDNTATNRLVWSTLQQQKPNIFFHGCISHTVHLAVKDLVGRLPWLGKLTKDCRKLVRFLKSQQLWYQLKRLQCVEGKPSLGLPTETLWGTIKRYFSTVLASEKIQHAFVSGRGFLRARTKVQNTKRRHACDTVVARDFVQQLEKAIKLLKVISKFQKAFENNSKPPSEVYHMFLLLPEEFKKMEMPISELDKIQQILDERFNFVYGDAHGGAYLLCPRYLGQGMDQETRDSVQEFIANWQGSGEEEATTVGLVNYLGGQRSTSLEVKLIRQKQLTVAQYWGGLSQFPLLHDIALTAFASACSSAAEKRTWAAQKFVHSQARNRLNDESVEKLDFPLLQRKEL